MVVIIRGSDTQNVRQACERWDVCKKIKILQGKEQVKRSSNKWQENIKIYKKEMQYEHLDRIKLV
jgi:hypothetical protein